MKTETILERQNIQELLEEKQKSVVTMAKEIAESEFEILELNFLISSQITEQDSKKTDEYIHNLRNKINNKEVNLDEANDYIKSLQ